MRYPSASQTLAFQRICRCFFYTSILGWRAKIRFILTNDFCSAFILTALKLTALKVLFRGLQYPLQHAR